MLENLTLHPQLIEAYKRVIPTIGDFIMYQGRLLEVVKIKHFRQCLIIESDRAEISLPLKVGYRIFTPVREELMQG